MSLVVRRDLSVPIPEEMARDLGLHEGSPVEWERTPDGGLTLRPSRTRAEIARALLGAGQKYLKPGESGVEGFLKWREEERRLDETY